MTISVICQVFQVMLTCCGYEVTCVAESEAAISAYQIAAAANQPCLGVILDLHSPIGLAGDLTLTRLREINPDVKAVICSADVHHPVMIHYETYGFEGALAKPFDQHVLEKLLTLVFQGVTSPVDT